ncbi:MAG: FumA C-terminus/TtdB family hydratase beta subunit [Bacillota bacterium]|nr:FumA C-terminus/TtdB family hydratase beta subunit [Bacillota bacterium]
MTAVRLLTPLAREALAELRAGQPVLFTGWLYTARDMAHQRLVEALRRGEKLPFDPRGAVIYYAGPAPARPGEVVGPVGPTTSGRMDPYTPALLAAGVAALIGKGRRSPEVRRALAEHGAIYCAAVGGAAAYLRRFITACELVAYPDLGPEAVWRLAVQDFPAVVVNDTRGGDLYEEAAARYRQKG